MKKNKRKNHAARTGFLFGLITFIALSLFAGSVTQISREVGLVSWALDFLAYTLLNKLFYKLIVAFLVGGFVSFAVSMVEYGKAVKHNKLQPVRFQQTSDAEQQSTRIA